MNEQRKPGRVALAVVLALAATMLATGTAAPAAVAKGQRPPALPTGEQALTKAELQKVLSTQDLPFTERIPITKSSHPFNGAAWQNVPINLAKYGYTEKEYYLSGTSNVYDWIPGSDFQTTLLRSGDYTTRMTVRMPKNMKHFSGDVVVEIINMSAGYDWTAIWSALWERTLKDGDIYVGVTSKPNVIPGMQRFDQERYAKLNWDNPLPPDQQACGKLPGEDGYRANQSKLWENGLAWDMFTQTGRLLKSKSKYNPLGAPAKRVYLSGESQSGDYLLTYYRFFGRAAATGPAGKPVFDGFFAETGTLLGESVAPINQCATETTPIPAGDTLNAFPYSSIPYVAVNSTWDYPGGFSDLGPTPTDRNTSTAKFRAWELAGANHGWEWQYDYGDANAEDLIAAGFDDPATYDWSCGANNPEVPMYMAEKAAYVGLKRWVASGKAPARAPRILTYDSGETDRTLYDSLHNAMGGLRMPMIDVPVASFGIGRGSLTADCPEIVPFDQQTLASLYPSKAHYLKAYAESTNRLVREGFILKEDVPKLLKISRAVTSIPIQGS